MPTTVQGPDGSTFEFPDGMSPQDIQAAMAKHYGPPAPSDDQLRSTLHGILTSPNYNRQSVLDFVKQYSPDQLGPNLNSVLDWADAHSPAQRGQIQIGVSHIAPTIPADNPIYATAKAAANGVAGGLLNKVGAAGDALIPGIGQFDGPGVKSMWEPGSSFEDAYQHNLGLARAEDTANEAAYPNSQLAANVAGALASPINKIAGTAAGAVNLGRLGTGLAQGALYGAASGFGNSNANTAGGAAYDTALGAAEGLGGAAAGHAIGSGIGRVVSGVTDPAKRTLAAAGVRLTPGQIAGGWLANTERKATSFPLAGPAINDALAQSGQDWSDATVRRAANAFDTGNGVTPGASGSQAFSQAHGIEDAAYDSARSQMQFQRTPQFDQGLAQIRNDAVTGTTALAEPQQKQLENVVQNTVLRRIGPNGAMTGDDYKTVVSDLRQAAFKALDGRNPSDQREYGAYLNRLADHIEQTAYGQSTPEAQAAMDAANRGHAYLATAQTAADLSGPKNAGRFNPTQYLSAVEKNDNTVRNRAFTEGKAFDQQWGQQGLNVLGDAVPNSFSADRLALLDMAKAYGGALAGGEGLGYMVGHPGAGGVAAAALPAADIALRGLYTKPALKALNAFAFAGGAARAKVGQQLNDFLAPNLGRALTASAPALGIQSTAH